MPMGVFSTLMFNNTSSPKRDLAYASHSAPSLTYRFAAMKSESLSLLKSDTIFMCVISAIPRISFDSDVAFVLTMILFSQLKADHMLRKVFSSLHLTSREHTYHSAGLMYSIRLTDTSFRFTTTCSAELL